MGAGELMVTAVDREGTRAGFDIDLIQQVRSAVSIPVIASGGMGTMGHFLEAAQEGGADGVAMADVLHYGRMSLADIRAAALDAKLEVREI